MKVISTDFPGLFILEPRVFFDDRGYFFESFNKKDFEQATGHSIDFVQDNESMSSKGVIRGLHFQKPPYAQSKLVRCVLGAVYDVAVDIRVGSPTFGKSIGVMLTEENHRQLFIPRGFAHGFAVVTDKAVFQYKCDNYYSPQSEGGICLNDPSLSIEWPFDASTAILSEKDKRNPMLNDFTSPFIFNSDL